MWKPLHKSRKTASVCFINRINRITRALWFVVRISATSHMDWWNIQLHGWNLDRFLGKRNTWRNLGKLYMVEESISCIILSVHHMVRSHYSCDIDIRNCSSQRSYPIQPYTPIHFTLSVIINVKDSSVFEFYYARASEKDHLGLIKDDFETDEYKTGLGKRLHSFHLFFIAKSLC